MDKEGGRIGIDFLKTDGKPRRHMTDAWIRFATRRGKGKLTLPIEAPIGSKKSEEKGIDLANSLGDSPL